MAADFNKQSLKRVNLMYSHELTGHGINGSMTGPKAAPLGHSFGYAFPEHHSENINTN
jgi:hypothetical protein